MQRPEPPPPQDADKEFRAIEAALLETARGRWFLAEHGRRSRRMETSALETAIGQLKSSLRAPPAVVGRIKSDLQALVEEVTTARSAVMQRVPVPAKDSPEVNGTHAPQGILQAAEELHELAWALQSRDVDAETCTRIGRQAASIFALAAQQSQESQRARRFSEALDRLMERLQATLQAVDQEQQAPGEDAEAIPASAIKAAVA
ncbi:MAG TPA: hypothetical protein PK264_21140 [Hyphomicrobiaceae bacterium]|nr:hypothetical protein [Hyphomicrobiaceae bacterium]